MKTAGRENPNRWAHVFINRARGAAGQNPCLFKWAAKQEKLQSLEELFFLTSPFIERYLVGQLYGLRSGILRSGDSGARTAPKSLRSKSVTYVAGTFCNPCVRVGPVRSGAPKGTTLERNIKGRPFWSRVWVLVSTTTERSALNG